MGKARCKVAVLASGRGTNFQAIAEASRDPSFPAQVVCLITDNADAGALDAAQKLNVSTHVLKAVPQKARLSEDTEREIVSICEQNGAELVVLAGFMRILAGPLLDRFANRILNIHPSLLPSFKGLHAVRQALDYGVKLAGCTVHFVDKTVDGGAIVMQAAVDVYADDDEARLLARIQKEEHRIYVQAVKLFAEGRIEVTGRRVRIGDAIKSK